MILLLSCLSSYLACRHELQRPQSTAHVGDVGLELIEGGCDLRLDLGGFGPRWAVGRDLVECLLRHGAGGGWCRREEGEQRCFAKVSIYFQRL